jgi:hypothetical protein
MSASNVRVFPVPGGPCSMIRISHLVHAGQLVTHEHCARASGARRALQPHHRKHIVLGGLSGPCPAHSKCFTFCYFSQPTRFVHPTHLPQCKGLHHGLSHCTALAVVEIGLRRQMPSRCCPPGRVTCPGGGLTCQQRHQRGPLACRQHQPAVGGTNTPHQQQAAWSSTPSASPHVHGIAHDIQLHMYMPHHHHQQRQQLLAAIVDGL